MHPDAQRWEPRHRRGRGRERFDVDVVLSALAEEDPGLLPARGRALEIACGTAGTALWLAARGLETVALDISRVALVAQRDEARRRKLELGLVAADALALPLALDGFDLIVVTRYLERGLFPLLRDGLRPGGRVFFRTFNSRHLEGRPGFNPAFVLQPGELAEAFAGLRILALEDGDDSSHVLARRPH